ncbi:TPA: DUF968 domain-containing protein [Citrobacter freundii]|nr:DUF968 domain-containing protein [Citrobacter freundii]HCA0665059.1 DUF968 domain-containing protein [Citrobacter freundii]HCA1829968.1 DUF968 domain-containing protein [Citrobacter freundii]HCA1870300.1 DUF968 domain-containing protein [Citrobacter freundii]
MTRTEAGDFNIMPLCRVCHTGLHGNAAVWEQKHVSQLEYILRIQHHTLGLEVIIACIK